MRLLLAIALAVEFALAACASAAQGTRPADPAAGARASDAELPVREVSVFKDGHAFVLRERALAAEDEGKVVLERLPVPVLGTFWPYATGGARIVSATASKQLLALEKTALDVRELLEANSGREAQIVDVSGTVHLGTLMGIPRRDPEEARRLEPATGGPRAPVKGSVVLLRSEEGTRAIPLEQIRNAAILGETARTYHEEELRDRLTLRLERTGSDPLRVGVVYVQKGLRWIPSHKVDIDGAGRARMEMEATLQNDLIDLADATVHLVIGVPRFEFASMVDPISLQDVAADLAAKMREQDQMSGFLSNAIRGQSAAWRGEQAPAAPSGPAGPEVVGGESNEDLFVFTIEHVSLREGERMALHVTELEAPYRDVHVLDVPFAPPAELRDAFQGERGAELARLLSAPKVVHVLRMSNRGSAPWTTAPALLTKNGQVLSQSLLAYTPVGGETDLPLTTAVDVLVHKTEVEAGRTPNAAVWSGTTLSRTDMAGTIKVTNHKKQAIDLEVHRLVLGIADSAVQGGTLEQMSLAELWGRTGRGEWWSSWSWPYWWHHWNGVGRFTWKLRLAPGETVELEAKWHYFWA